MASRALRFALASLVSVLSLVPACVEHQPDDSPTEADWAIIKQNLLPSIPTMQHTVNTTIGDRVVFLGCDSDSQTVTPGKPFVITYYWKVNSAPDSDWKNFTHVNGPNGQGFINADHTPVYNKYPVKLWKAGDIIKDVQNLSVPASWSYNTVNVYVGLWVTQDTRVPVTDDPNKANDGTNRVLAISLPVVGGGGGPAKKLTVRRATGPIKLDGKLDEPDWAQATASSPFVDNATGAAAPHKTQAKILYDDNNLYLGYTVEDPDITADITQHDGKLYTQDVVELMVDADGDGQTYEEFEVSPTNVTFDTYLPTYRANSNDPSLNDWESGMKSAAVIDGTANDPSDTDKGYTVEAAIPLAAFKGKQTKPLRIPPIPGDHWRANLYQLDLGKGQPLEGYAWSPTMVPDFHALAQFGELDFADANGVVPPPPAASQPAASLPVGGPASGPVRPMPLPMGQQVVAPRPMLVPIRPNGLPPAAAMPINQPSPVAPR
jgi:hypothetical protein